MEKKASIVIGAGYGDEGKGLTTEYLCSKSQNPLVIRYNGGQQAGHTVVDEKGRRHVFSNFGSGTLHGVPTFWSKYCTFAPANVWKEYQALKNIGCSPLLFVDTNCYVTTHYDVLYNQILELQRGNSKHGSCGMGFGATIERNEVGKISFQVSELNSEQAIRDALLRIRNYYSEKLKDVNVVDFNSLDHEKEDTRFVSLVSNIIEHNETFYFANASELISEKSSFSDFIFEGAQGIMLDMDFGHFPHVTRSNTSSKNALNLIQENFPSILKNTEIFYISRFYQTRHGAGPMTNVDLIPNLINTENETNVFNQHQGNFRISALDVDQLMYAIQCDLQLSKQQHHNLVFTCADQLPEGKVLYSYQGKSYYTEIHTLINLVSGLFPCKDVFVSHQDKSIGVEKVEFQCHN